MLSRARRDVVVVGGGVAGLTLAYELARRGADVALVDAGASPGGASAVPAALLNPHRGRTARARQGDLAGLAAFWRLARRLEEEGLDPGAHATGVLRVAPSPRQAALWREAAAGTGDGPRWLAPAQAPAGVNAPHGALLVPSGGWAEPARLLSALATAAARRGAELLRGVAATAVSTDGGSALVTTSGGALRARHVVLCPGAAPAPPGCRLPRLAAEGGVAAVLRLPAGAAAPRGLLPLAGAVNVVVAEGRAVVTGGSLPPERPAPAELRSAALGLRDAASWALPALEGAELEAVWFGVRSRRPSGRPVVRRLAPAVTLYGALAGRGFLCAADLSSRLAERSLGG